MTESPATWRSRARASIAKSAGKLRGRTPTLLVGGLVAAALTPAVVPLVGGIAGGVAGGVILSQVLDGLLGSLKSVGESYIERFLDRFISRCRPGDEESTQEQLAAAVAHAMEEPGPEGDALRAQFAQLLRAIGGVQAALSAATDDLRAELVEGFAQVARDYAELRFITGEVAETLRTIAARQSEQLSLQREQLDLQRAQAVKVEYLINSLRLTEQVRARRPDEAVPGTATATEAAVVACPYRGLATFQVEDAALFFGRERLVAELTTRLSEQPALVIYGASGSGKSSIVRAGLIPRLTAGDAPPEWLLLTPTAQPVEELARRIALRLGRDPLDLLHALEADPRTPRVTLAAHLGDRPEGFLLVVDQMEELFTLCTDTTARRRFLTALALLVGGHPALKVIMVIRADFVGELGDVPELLPPASDRQVLVGPMSEAELLDAIVKPARAAGLTVESGVIQAITTEIGGNAGALPLASHALVETWERREGTTLTLRGYLAGGGVRGAIAQTAERVYQEVLDERQRELTRGLFLRLTAISETGLPSRRRAGAAELQTPELRTVIERLARARLVTTAEDGLTLAHEALLREWPRLVEWIADARADLQTRQRLQQAAADWAALGRDPDALYRGARLTAARTLAEADPESLSEVEREFVAAGAAAERDQLEQARRRARRLRWIAATLAVALVTTAGAAVVAADRTAKAEEEQRSGTSRRLAAQAIAYAETRLDTAMLLAVEAHRTAPTSEAQQALLRLRAIGAPRQRHIDDGRTRAAVIAFDRDGRSMASYDENNGPVVVRDVATGKVRARIPASYTLLGFSGGEVLTQEERSGPKHVITYYDGSDGTKIRSRTFRVPGARYPNFPVLSRNGTVIAIIGGNDGAQPGNGEYLAAWDARTGERLISGRHPGLTLQAMAVSANGRHLVAASEEGPLVVTDLRAGTSRRVPLKKAAGLYLAINSTGTRIAIERGTTVELIDAHGEVKHVLPVAQQGPARPIGEGSLQFADDDTVLARAGWSGSLTLWDSAGNPITTNLAAGPAPVVSGLAFVPGSTMVATANGTTRVTLWDLSAIPRLGVPIVLTASARPRSVALAPGGVFAAALLDDNTVILADLRNEPPTVRKVPTTIDAEFVCVGVSRDGTTLALADRENTIHIVDANGTARFVIKDFIEKVAGLSVNWLRFDTYRRHLAIGFGLDNIRGGQIVFDGTGRMIWATRLHDNVIPLAQAGLAFSPNGKRVAGAFTGGLVEIVDLETAKVSHALRVGSDFAPSLSFSPDGRHLAAGDIKGNVTMWDATTGERRKQFTGASDFVHATAFNPNGTLLAAGTATGQVKVWEVATHRELTPLVNTHGGGISELEFASPDVLLAKDENQRITRWDLAPADAARALCDQAGRNLTAEERTRFEITSEKTCPQWK